MGWRDRQRKQKAQYWAANGVDGEGQPKVDTRIELDVRWEEGKSQAVSALSNTVEYDAVVWADRVIPIGSVLWKGTEEDLPATPTDLRTVVDYIEIPDVRNRSVERVALLQRQSNTLPTLA